MIEVRIDRGDSTSDLVFVFCLMGTFSFVIAFPSIALKQPVPLVFNKEPSAGLKRGVHFNGRSDWAQKYLNL
jgi:hypothetical protein